MKSLSSNITLLAALLALTLTACKDREDTGKNPVGITISEASLKLYVGESITLFAEVKPEDANQKVSWSSSNEAIATVNDEGVVSALKVGGPVIITATAANNKSDACTVNIFEFVPVASITITGDAGMKAPGQSDRLTANVQPANASIKTLVWDSSDPSLVSIDEYGQFSIPEDAAAGTVTITAFAIDGSARSGATTINVGVVPTAVLLSETAISIAPGACTIQLTATIEPPTAAYHEIEWLSSNTSRATVNGNGLVTVSAGVPNGSIVEITARVKDFPNCRKICEITTTTPAIPVTGISLNQTTGNLNAGESLQLTANILPANASNKTVLWSSDNTSRAMVSSTGIVTAQSNATTGTVIITATSASNSSIKQSCTISVKETPKTIITMETSQNSITFTMTGTGNLEVEWGDGTTETGSISKNWQHTYSGGTQWRTVKVKAVGQVSVISMSCEGQKLGKLVFETSSDIETLNCNNNSFSTLNLSSCSKLKIVRANNVEPLGTLTLTCSSTLEELSISNTNFYSLTLSNYVKLKNMELSNSNLKNLSLMGCTALSNLNCSNGSLEKLNLIGCTALSALDCSHNKLNQISVSGCTALYQLNCSYNSGVGTMDPANVNDLFRTLTDAANVETKTVNIRQNGHVYLEKNGTAYYDGTDHCDRNIAVNRGWKVVTSN